MKLHVENRYSGTPERVFASHVDQGVREQACRDSGAVSWEVSISPAADGGATVQVERNIAPDLPDYIAKIVGGQIKIRQVERWSAPDAQGGRSADIKLTIVGQPASMDGTASLTAAGDGAVEVVSGEVKVAVPIIGRKFEPDIVKVIESAMRVERQASEQWLLANS